jgi:peptide/nickel transport system substrate-binding protein
MGLESGALDLVSHLSSTQVAELNKDNFNIEQGTMNLVQALYLNNEVAPFDNELVRQALCYAIDRQGILDMAFDGYGFLIGSNVFPAFTKYFDDSLTNYYTLETPEAGKEKAKELLAEAGYPDGFDMTITVPSNYTPHCDTAEVIAEQLKEVGINATLNKVEWETWVSDTYAGRNFQSTVIGLTADPLTARSLLERFTTGQRVEDEEGNRGNNFINYNNEEYDALFEQAIKTYDDEEQTKIYKEMEKNLTEHAASVYIQDMADMVAVRKGLTGLTFYPLYVLDVSTLKWE